MRVLVVSDSHVYSMDAAILSVRKEWEVLSICHGRGSEAVRVRYMSRVGEAERFNPEAMILHIGHNDLWYHPFYNTHPQNVKDFSPFVQSFVTLLRDHHPSAQIIYSSVYPRSVGPHLDETEKRSYNKLPQRYGVLTQSTCKRKGISFILNGTLWSSVRQGKEISEYFLADGLHLNTLGKKVVAVGWIGAMEAKEGNQETV
jgi:lysophospholipase L1-like esterase